VLGRLVSVTGTGIQSITIPLYILDITGSGAYMGIFIMLSLLPSLILSPFAGVIGDRFNRKKIMVNSDFLDGLVILLLAFITYTNRMNITILFTAQVIVSLIGAMFSAATSAMIPELVEEEELNRANAIIGGVNNFSMIVGPALGGIIYGIWGIGVVFLLNGMSFILSAISEIFIKYTKKHEEKEKLSTRVFFKEIKEGISYIFSYKGLMYLFLFSMILNFIISPIFPVVVPYITRKVIKFSAQQYGFLETSFTVGMLIGNFIFALFLSKAKAKKLMVFGLFFFLIMNTMFAFAVFPKSVNYFGGPTWEFFTLLASIMAIMGLSMPIMNTPVMTNMQKMVPNNLRSRVFSVSSIISQAGVPLGAAIYGFMLDKIPAHYIYLGANILCLGVSVFVFMIAPDEMFDPRSEKLTTEEL
jgi:MFS family permease